MHFEVNRQDVCDTRLADSVPRPFRPSQVWLVTEQFASATKNDVGGCFVDLYPIAARL